VFGDDPEAAYRLIDNWESSLKERAERAKSFADQGAGITVTARDPDGIVEVTVDSTGVVTGLHLSERIRRQSAADVADLILATMRKAQAQLSRRMAEVAAETMGGDSDVTRAVVASYEQRFPAPPPEEQSHGR
jgi:DNA-binding protein YbaB